MTNKVTVKHRRNGKSWFTKDFSALKEMFKGVEIDGITFDEDNHACDALKYLAPKVKPGNEPRGILTKSKGRTGQI
jgi:hypothetical protein